MKIEQCSVCAFKFGQGTSRAPCQRCGDTSRTIAVSITEELQVFDGLEYKVRDPRFMRKDKVRSEGFHKYVRSKVGGRLVLHQRKIDRAQDGYFELVKDVLSQETLRSVNERLSEHRGYGSAKFEKTTAQLSRNAEDD